MAIGVEYQIKLQDKFSGKLSKASQKVDKLNKRIDKLNKGANKIGQMLSGLGVGFAAFNLLKGSGNIIIEFDERVADLGAILGKTGTELDFFKNKSIELSKESTKSASSIIEAFKLVGSAKPELLKNQEALASVTKEAITLSEAARLDVPEAARALTGALNSMQLPAEESARVIDVLANASKLGAKEIPFINSALDKFGGVAAQAGVSIDESVSAIETLGKVIPQAEIVGTSLRTILIKLQKAAADEGREFKGLSKELELLAPDINNVSKLTKKFEEGNLLAIQTLITERDSLEELTGQLGKLGTAQEQAIQQSGTLAAQIEKTKNSWGSFMVGIEDGDNKLGNFIKGSLKFIQQDLSDTADLFVDLEGAGIGFIDKVQGLFMIGDAMERIRVAAANTRFTSPDVPTPLLKKLPTSIFDELGGTPTDKDGDPLTPGGKKGKGLKTGISEVKAGAPKTFNINIEKLVDEFNVQTTNMEQAPSRVKDMVQQALLTALADLSIQSE